MKALSLFSGCGGCSLGLRQAGFEVKLAVDIDVAACETYLTNLKGETVWRTDLSNIISNEVLEKSQIKPLEINLIVGGPPCQGFSSAGSKDWNDPRNILLRKFVEIITSLKPTWFVMENVEGLLTAREGFYITEAILKFLEAGYWVRAKKVYMERYGLPQRRKRVFVVGNLEQCEFDFPPPTCFESTPLVLFDQRPELSLLNAIGDLPTPAESGVVFYDKQPECDYQAQLRQLDGQPVTHHQIKRVSAVIQQRIHLLGQGGTMKDLPKTLQHPSFTKRAFRRVMDGTPTEKRGGAPSGLKRLFAAKPSLTITSASPTEFIHPTEDRLLTLRECARLQSFPDWYEFHGSWTSVATQIGNAIPPMFMELLATHIKKRATWQSVSSSKGRWLGIDATKSEGMSPALAKMLTQLDKKTYIYR